MNKCKCCCFKVFDCCMLDCDIDADFCEYFEQQEQYDDCSIESELMAEMIEESIKDILEDLKNG